MADGNKQERFRRNFQELEARLSQRRTAMTEAIQDQAGTETQDDDAVRPSIPISADLADQSVSIFNV